MKKFCFINLFLLTLVLSASAQTKPTKKPAARRTRPRAAVVRTVPPPATTGLGSGIGSANGSGMGAANGSGIGNSAANGADNNAGGGRRTVIVMPSGEGVGNRSGSNPENQASPAGQPELTPLMILDKPAAEMTEQARQNNVSGVVRLRVTFLASGQIGSVSVVRGLPHGLTESAVKAAKEIKFQPARRDSILIPQTKIIEYTFPQN